MEEGQTVRLSFAAGGTETVYVTRLTPNCFRLRVTPVSGEDADGDIYLGDVIEVELEPGGAYRFVRVVERR